MERELVEKLAREAGLAPSAWIVRAQYPFATLDAPIEGGLPREELFPLKDLESFAKAVAEECARICLGPHGECGPPNYTQGVRDGAAGCANMIRERFSLDAPQQEGG
jgi:hypothetical protein